MKDLVLYRKYRPQTFSEVVGQEHVVRTLKNSLVENKLAHAYLLAGPRGSGKTTIARLLAKAANCSGRGQSPEPCNKCASCEDVNSGRSLDLIEIDAASNRGIDEIRALRENVRFGPSSGRYKIYLIDEAHMITKDAFNAFLKTLEEPPAHAIFILATTEAHRLLATIISRTQRFDFKRLSPVELAGRLETICKKENVSVEPETLKLIAHEADGAARDAEGMLGQILATGEKKITLAHTEEILGLFSPRKIKALINFVAAQDRAGALNWLHQTVEAGYDVGQLLKALNHYLRKMMMVKLSPELALKVKQELAEEDYATLAAQAQNVNHDFLISLISTLPQVKQGLDHYPLPQMALEVALINLLSDKRHETRDMVATQAQNPKSETLNPKQTQVSNDQKSKPEIRNPSSETQDSNVLNLIQSKWSEVINEVRPHNHSLSGFLMGMKPQSATADSITLVTKYSFHRDRLSELKNKKIIEDAVEKIAGRRLILSCILEK